MLCHDASMDALEVIAIVEALRDINNLQRYTLKQIQILRQEVKHMADLTQDQLASLDTELTQVETDLTTLGQNLSAASTEQQEALADLEAKLARGNTDIGPELARLKAVDATIQSTATSVTALGASATAADPGAPAPVVPVPVAGASTVS
jgi:chromosome segregation ATPase